MSGDPRELPLLTPSFPTRRSSDRLERGKPVRERTQDTWGLWRKSVLNPASNVQFGEGGAGLFSDGKLYSQVKDPKFHGRKVLHEFVKAGAPDEILYVSKPHKIGRAHV